MTAAGRLDAPAALRCVTPDGLGIAAYDFGGRGPDLVLVHATGFCAAPFVPMARALSARFRCWGLDLRGHGASDRPDPVRYPWSDFATDVLAVIDHLGLQGPIGFGHSCGGAAVLLAEQRRPGTFSTLYCFEPVVLPPAPRALVAGDNPLAAGARRRRSTFGSAEEALVNFSAKPPFAELDPEALAHYVEAGFEPVPSDEGGGGRMVRLRCRREDEAAVYEEAVHHDAFERLGQIGCPVTFACGADTDAFGPGLVKADAAEVARSRVEILPAMGHFGPLQAPGRVAVAVAAAVDPRPERTGAEPAP